MRYLPNAKNKAFVYTCAIVALGVYGIPRIPSLQPGIEGTFSMVWILFSVLALASNLYFLVGADKERSRMLETYEIKGTNHRDHPDEGLDTQHRRAH